MPILTWKAVSGNQAAGRATLTRHVLKEELNKERYCCPSGVCKGDMHTKEKLCFLETQVIGEAMAWKQAKVPLKKNNEAVTDRLFLMLLLMCETTASHIVERFNIILDSANSSQ